MRNHPQGHPRQGQNKGTTHPRHPRHNQIPPENRQNHTHPTPHTRGDHPRIRGEHPSPRLSSHGSSGSSPHTRGAQGFRQAHGTPRRIIPAYAGSTRSVSYPTGAGEDHPRIRGEHRLAEGEALCRQGSSPHTRGAPLFRQASDSKLRIIPAYAGSTTPAPSSPNSARDHPRIRGEHRVGDLIGGEVGGSSPHTRGALPPRTISEPWTSGSSPHTRGARCAQVDFAHVAGIIPAYAGSTRGASPTPWSKADHPRIRGEHARGCGLARRRRGSSPHTRGARGCPVVGQRWGGIIPAYAGSTRTAAWSTRRAGDHPRIRGEHRLSGLYTGDGQGSSPHTRGALATWTAASISPTDHPRIRGEHVSGRGDPHKEGGSSPHTRGARLCIPSVGVDVGIIPAYAGSTQVETGGGIRMWDHPRIRGEHLSLRTSVMPTNGSSPHTRGAHRPEGDRGHHERIIPAYAGSTSS